MNSLVHWAWPESFGLPVVSHLLQIDISLMSFQGENAQHLFLCDGHIPSGRVGSSGLGGVGTRKAGDVESLSSLALPHSLSPTCSSEPLATLAQRNL